MISETDVDCNYFKEGAWEYGWAPIVKDGNLVHSCYKFVGPNDDMIEQPDKIICIPLNLSGTEKHGIKQESMSGLDSGEFTVLTDIGDYLYFLECRWWRSTPLTNQIA